MHEALKVATTICTTMLRNGYDAHIVNAPLQQHLLETSDVSAVDIACEPDIEVLGKLFPSLVTVEEGPLMAQLEEDGVTIRFVRKMGIQLQFDVIGAEGYAAVDLAKAIIRSHPFGNALYFSASWQ